ncbi:flippase activity-associated protein Agl23 [Planctomycetota bacterium]
MNFNFSNKCCVLIIIAAIAAAALRLPHLEQRPMHTDEAVNADKFGRLLEDGSYRYNPEEFHGPTLNFLTLIPAWLGSEQKLSDVSEFTLRIVPVFFGLLVILLLLLLADGLGTPATIMAAVLTAVSPAFVFYSRYYIHEILLVFFSFGVIASAYRYIRDRKIMWALLTGMFLGLMHATKETCIIALGSMLSTLVLTLMMQHKKKGLLPHIRESIKASHILVAITTAFFVSALFTSSFLTNPGGIADSFRTYAVYLNRATENQVHIHPWYYYLGMLTYFKVGSGPVWSEAFIIVLAFFGFIFAMTKRYTGSFNPLLIRFFAFYTLIMIVIYSAIPYKTPWSMLGFLHGMIVMAGFGSAVFLRIATNLWRKAVVVCVLLASVFSLTFQAYIGSFHLYADQRNPYVYAHTGKDIFTITQRIEQISSVHPDGRNMYIQLICTGDDYWPLPWYLRKFSTVSYQNKVEENLPSAPVIIASPALEKELIRKLYELSPPGKKNLYVPLFDSQMELRPQVELLGFVTKDLWDRFRQQAQSGQTIKK